MCSRLGGWGWKLWGMRSPLLICNYNDKLIPPFQGLSVQYYIKPRALPLASILCPVGAFILLIFIVQGRCLRLINYSPLGFSLIGLFPTQGYLPIAGILPLEDFIIDYSRNRGLNLVNILYPCGVTRFEWFFGIWSSPLIDPVWLVIVYTEAPKGRHLLARDIVPGAKDKICQSPNGAKYWFYTHSNL